MRLVANSDNTSESIRPFEVWRSGAVAVRGQSGPRPSSVWRVSCGTTAPSGSLFSGRKHCEEIDCFLMAVIAHVILLVDHRVFAFTRRMAVTSALALALILRHLVPL